MKNIPTAMVVVAGALRGADGRWLMHRRPFDKHHGGLWEFPGGKVEAGESRPAALVREMQEELGIEVDQGALVEVASAATDGGDGSPAIVIYLYTIGHWIGQPAALEGEAIGWFDFAEIAALEKPPLDVELSAALFAANGADRIK